MGVKIYLFYKIGSLFCYSFDICIILPIFKLFHKRSLIFYVLEFFGVLNNGINSVFTFGPPTLINKDNCLLLT